MFLQHDALDVDQMFEIEKLGMKFALPVLEQLFSFAMSLKNPNMIQMVKMEPWRIKHRDVKETGEAAAAGDDDDTAKATEEAGPSESEQAAAAAAKKASKAACGESTDGAFIFDDATEIHAHRLILSHRSTFFQTLLDNEARSSNQLNYGNSRQPLRVRIKDIERAVFMEIIRYIYCGHVR